MIASLARAGSTPLHRMRADVKLVGLTVTATALFFVASPKILAVVLAVGFALARSTGGPTRRLLRELRPPMIVLAVLGLADWLMVDAATAVVVVLRLGALMFVAHAVTATTTTSEFTDVLERLFRPLARIGLLDADRAALTVTLAIRFVPLIMDEVAEIRDAQAVRGLATNPVALAVPLLVRVLVRAEEVADAIDARGFPPMSSTGRDRVRAPVLSVEETSHPMTTRDIGLIALFAAVIVALGVVPAIPLAIVPVPITLQSLGIMLAGLVLGPQRGTLAALVVLVLVAIGLPVLAGGRGGLVVFTSPTAGFLVGWVFAAFVTGLLATLLDVPSRSAATRLVGLAISAIVGGVVVLYAFGIVWLAFGTGLGLAKAFWGSLAFIPGDLIKAVVAAIVTLKVRDAYALARK